MKKRIILISLLLTTSCNDTSKPILHYETWMPDLQPMISINNSVGAITTYGYNYWYAYHKIGIPYTPPVIPESQYVTTPIPQTQLQHQQYKAINSKLGTYYERP